MMYLARDKLERAIFKRRPNRFTVECLLKGRIIRAYLPNPGRLRELLLPSRLLYLQKNSSKEKLPYTVIATERDGIPILLHTHLTNTLVEGLIKERRIPGFEDMEVIKREASFGKSRYDFLLKSGKRKLVLEVKTCTLFGDRLAMFPDAITERGSRHLIELSRLKERKVIGGILFVVQWPFAKYFMPEYHTDPDFARNLLNLHERLLIKAIALGWRKDLSIDSVKDLIIPWELVERESEDRGSYIIIIYLKGKRSLKVGELGKIRFRKGYYLYAGSAKKGLTKRIERHKRKRKIKLWHIDYLREAGYFYKALPIRTGDDLECVIAERLGRIADWSVPYFGSSDCSCESHLFGIEKDPINSPNFIEVLKYFRIGRIERRLMSLYK